MRHIKKSDLRARVKKKWHDAATKALADISGLTADKRAKFISEFFRLNQADWALLKECFAQPLPPKCWYSEAQRPIAELEIDHYRPKGGVAKCQHAGYWWLAFNWENLRLSTSLANKRRRDFVGDDIQGKGTFFPLWDESKRVSDIAPCSVKEEEPLLLDPFEAKDVLLLDYSPEDGKVVERYKESKNKIGFTRAEKSIELYHLNEGTLVARRGELAALIASKGDKIEQLWSRKEGGATLTKNEQDDLNLLQNELADLINSNAEFSAFCRACLRQRGSRGWNEELLSIV